jgi:CRP-like cAMP-binding protein
VESSESVSAKLAGAGLASIAPFGRLTGEQLSRLAATAREVRFPAGLTIFADDQPATGCWLLRSGQVALGTEVPGRGLVGVRRPAANLRAA